MKKRRLQGRVPSATVTLFSQLGAMAGDDVVISTTIYLDTNTPALDSLTIASGGMLVNHGNASANITAGYIEIQSGGELCMGTVAVPYTGTCVIELTGSEASRTTRTILGTNLGFTNDGVGRSLQVMPGGKLTLIGNPPGVHRTRLAASATSSATSFTLADSVSWPSGGTVVIGPTDFYGTSSGASQSLTLSGAVSGTSMSTTGGISASRYGVLQYPTDSGMSLSAGTFTKPHVDVPGVLDERAPVVLLDRNITIQGANDSAWSTSKFGGHCMFMGLSSEVKIDGVRFRRMGQAGANGRYPLHWHMNSYNMPSGMDSPSDGTFLGTKTTDFVKRSVIDESGQRAVVIHGTHGITIDKNVAFDIVGHAFFLEDGSEQSCVLTDNVAMKVRVPDSANKLLIHDKTADSIVPAGSAGYWFANPANTFTGNWAFDCQGCGIWNSFANDLFGLSDSVALVPRTTELTLHANNIGACNGGVGMLTNRFITDARGTLAEQAYDPGVDGAFTISTFTGYKNTFGGYNNRVTRPTYSGWTMADNEGQDFFGQASVEGIGRRHLCVSESLNNATSRAATTRRAAFASYHELLNFQDCVLFGYGYIAPTAGTQGAGSFNMSDLYTEAVFTFALNTGLTLIDTPAPQRALPPNLDGYPLANRHWTLAGAIVDENGIFVPAGRSWIYDNTFLTYGATDLTDVDPAGSNGKHTTSLYYGVQQFITDFDTGSANGFQAPILITRQDGGTDRGTWEVANGLTSTFLGNMRHFAAQKEGRYKITFPGNLADSYVTFTVSYAFRSTDFVTLGVEFDGSVPVSRVQVVTRQWGAANYTASSGQLSAGQARTLNNTSMTSIADVEADTTGLKYWQDTANDMVWIRFKGGLNHPSPFITNYDEETYRYYLVAIAA